MSQQTIRQQARRTAREMANRRRRERLDREGRIVALAEQIMVAIGERDAAVTVAEQRAGDALRQLTDAEGLSVKEAVEWCGETLTAGEAKRLMRLGPDDADACDGQPPLEPSGHRPARLPAHVDPTGAAG
ncbi:hypothetical protein GCM10023339_40740 [Alloalcanivorax gelatiniphagus]